MSHYRSRGDRTEAQLKKAGRDSNGGAGSQRGGSFSTLKGGGAGGPSPSASAPPSSAPPPANHVAPSTSSTSSLQPRPSTPGTPPNKGLSGRRANEPAESSRGATGGPPDHNSSTQQPVVLQPAQSPQLAQKQQLSASLSSSKPIVKQNHSSMEVPRPAAQPAFTFQFGSISPAFMHNTGLQIPARTSSAPPNLDEQKRDKAQYEAARASAISKAQTAIPSGPQQRHGPPHLPPASSLPPQVQVHSQVHLQSPIQMGEVHNHPQQPRLHPPLPQPGLVQHQGAKFSQPMLPSQHTGQMLPSHITNSMSGQLNHQLPPQMGHHLGPQTSVPIGGQLPPGLPGPQYGPPVTTQYIQPRTNRAVKIVNPNTHEELRFDSKVKKNDSDKVLPSGSSPQLSARLSNNGPAQPRIGVSYGGAPHHQMNVNFYPGVQVGPYGPTGPPFYRPGLPPSGLPPPGAGLPSNPPLRYGFTPPQGMPFVNHSVAPGPTIPPPAVMGIGLPTQGHGVPEANSPLPSNPPVQISFAGATQPVAKVISAAVAGRQGPPPLSLRPPGIATTQAGHDLKEKVTVQNGSLVHMDSIGSEGEISDTTTDSPSKILTCMPIIEIVSQDNKALSESQLNTDTLDDIDSVLKSECSNVFVEGPSEAQLEAKVNKGSQNPKEVASLKPSFAVSNMELSTRSAKLMDNAGALSSTPANDSVNLLNEKEVPVHLNSNFVIITGSITEAAISEAETHLVDSKDESCTSSSSTTSVQIDLAEEAIMSNSLNNQVSEISKDQVPETLVLEALSVGGRTIDDQLISGCETDNGHESFRPDGTDRQLILGSETKREMKQFDGQVAANMYADIALSSALPPLTGTSFDVQVDTSLVSKLTPDTINEYSNCEGAAVDLNSQSKTAVTGVAHGTAEISKEGKIVHIQHLESSSVDDVVSSPNSDQAGLGLGNSLGSLNLCSEPTEEIVGLDNTFQNLQAAEKGNIMDLQVPSRSTTVPGDAITSLEDVKASSNEDSAVNTHLESDSRSDKTGDCIINGTFANDVSSSNPIQEIDQTCVRAVGATQVSKRRKKKSIPAKADAAGVTSDLYSAYKTSEEKKQEKITQGEPVSTLTLANQTNKDASSEQPTKKELDDWEDAAEVAVSKGTADGVEVSLKADPLSTAFKMGYSGNRKYTRDFLLTFRELCFELPAHFEIRADISELLLNPESVQSGLAGDSSVNPGRNIDRQLSSSLRLERRGSVAAGPDEDRWTRQPGMVPSPGLGYTEVHMDIGMPGPLGGFRSGQNPGLIPRPGFRPGMPMLPPMMMGLIPGAPLIPQMMATNVASIRTNGPDADRWQRATIAQKGLIPSPHSALPAIHKAENKYEVGKVSDEETAKQRQIKAILNKLTPQNFDKLFEQVKEVHIESAATLTGVISQIFDKALLEPTFCEMYAKFCVQLSKELPEFNEDGEKVTFKRVLLNKCQEEFERGEREQEEAMRFTPEESEEKRLKARRQMLGNIRFIGELYKKSMLTERIMHECIKKLLGGYQNPDEEDVEALCKLMATIGRIIDHAKAKQHIDAYFDRMNELASNEKLSSRLRFMLKDVIDLRRNGWQERRKVEGPKKIDEVHRDAAHERQIQSGRDRFRGLSMGGLNRRVAPPADFGIRGPPSPMYSAPQPMGNVPPVASMRSLQPQTGLRNTFGQDVRMEDRLMENRPIPMPLSQRPLDEGPIMLGPQGGLGRGLGMRAQPSAPGRSALADSPVIHGDPRRSGIGPLSGMSGYPTGMSSERGPFIGRDDYLSVKSINTERTDKPLLARPGDRFPHSIPGRDLRSFEHSAIDKTFTNAAPPYQSTSVTSAPARASSFPQILNEEQLRKKSELIINEYFSARDLKEAAQCVDELRAPKFHSTMVSIWVTQALERKDPERDLLSKLLIHLSCVEPPLLSHEAITHGFESVLALLEDTIVDVPRAPDYVADMIGKLIAQDILPLFRLGNLLKDGGMEPGSLIESGDALKILGIVLETLRGEKGEAAMVDSYKSSGLDLEDFIMSRDNDGWNLDAFLEKWSLQCLYPMAPLEKHLREALDRNQEALEIYKWFEKNVPQRMITDGSFLCMVMTRVLKHCIPSLPVDHDMNILKGRTKKYAPLLRMFSSGKAKASEASQRNYIVAVQLFVDDLGHPPGLMSVLFDNFYHEEVISERAYTKWQDDVKDATPGRDKAIREVGKWLAWLATAPEEAADED
ncbi:hypothetical protein O6H91_01G025400 [Diphasiastrum complanatum]|uniref:Uncharacterized protein n=12 Tax=Diphasiastrum complanatum TaxID=34168 RepID=A0ACC2EPD6_DIPCM|nr:hypothetical protein O6H91_01G025400 [Diphasiastrum complanatum]KAJ7568259.1 hypothetical protein O6H91_01G025400 [Diphasiastrum complanatum]KAJ7568260.1 hypothetical protein O6H91_01G025400 [Diphasiastrum complanatum]KAJ7568261.1 hypothetical protein O6H91_01G025400 [Diphasiastrum complanatum]KAJ7568262.1 hypothetical protein O6H91_01G025400 [Diphasiastrum complanatum]